MSREILQDIIDDFSSDKFIRFFREKNRSFAPRQESFTHYNDEYFSDGIKLGEIKFSESEKLVVCAFKANQPLSERSGKKAQYEKGKKILKDTQLDAGIVIFYDKKGDFRFSLIYANYLGKKRDWSNFRRFTYFVSHEVTNKTFLQRIGDGEFSTIENIKEAFSVEPVNKEFYARIAMLFTRLAGGERRIGKDEFKGKGLLHLPSTTDDTLNKEFTIRLIGRLVFCWFLKKKHSESGLPLLSNELLSLTALVKNESYYHKILEPLFFEILNTPAEERKKKYYLEPWAHVPFLNGGLFSPDEHDFYEVDEFGFSKFLNVLKVPDKWIKDILEVFETYNFTIDENTSVDVELAIDPEILGRIFENLLAEINPETGETARKSTGSYYTPRPIVEYMVDESLKQYILTKVKISEDKVSSLLSYGNEGISLSESEKDSVLGALDVIKIIDPACGSGAFPMGILHKMLLILQKIDPDSQKWIERKLSQIENSTVRKELGKKLREKNWNYVHKLGIIQSSIYGVDIQPIATEISRLRFFLSLVVDEKVEDSEPNRGIDPLPNLEFKFVCANSLIPLAEEGGELFDNREMAQQMQDIRDRYFKTDNARIKVKMKNDFENVLKKGCSLFASRKQKQLLTYHPFDTNNICNFFDSKFMFGVPGFDIVIANPPWVTVRHKEISPDLLEQFRNEYSGAGGFKLNLFPLFVEKSFNLLKKNGLSVFIIPNRLLDTPSYRGVREKLLKEYKILDIENLPKGGFEEVVAGNIVLIAQKAINDLKKITVQNFYTKEKLEIPISEVLNNQNLTININLNSKAIPVIQKIRKQNNMFLKDICDVHVGMMVKNKKKEFIDEPKYQYSIVTGKELSKYVILKRKFFNFKKVEIFGGTKNPLKHLKSPKLLIRKTGNIILCSLDDKSTFAEQSVYLVIPKDEKFNIKFLNAFLNSALVTFYFQNELITNPEAYPYLQHYDLEKIPILNLNPNQQNPFVVKIDKIISCIQSHNFLQDEVKIAKVEEYERQIDQLIYKLYGLNKEEIKIVKNTAPGEEKGIEGEE